MGLLHVQQISKVYGSRPVLEQIDFTVEKGEFFGIIGPNGTGKSTLLKIISGIEDPSAGKVVYAGRNIAEYSRKQLARHIAVLQQESLPPIGFTVREVVEMGRYPYQNWLGDESEEAEELVSRIIEKLDLDPIQERTIDLLSGGERQRAAFGKIMAQQPRLLMLDEPTTHLDIGYQIQLMDYIRSWQSTSDLTVIAVLHDLNLAAQYCTRLLLIDHGQTAALGFPEQVLQEHLIEKVYGTRPILIRHPTNAVPQIILKGNWDGT